MSKQDFIALADALKRVKPVDNEINARVTHQWEFCCGAVARVCEQQNPAFKADRWFAYIAGECGPNGGTVKTMHDAIKDNRDAIARNRSGQ